MRTLRSVLMIAVAFLILSASSLAVRELVIIEEPQPAQRLEGVVLDFSGLPIADMHVSDCTDNWVAVLRTTTTDKKGHFRFSREPGKKIYNLRFDSPGWNPLQMKLRLDKKAPDRMITVKPQIGG